MGETLFTAGSWIVKKIKGSTVKPVKAAEMIKPVEPIVVNPKQAIQGAAGKAQGYLGKFTGKTPVEGMPGKKTKKKGAK